MVLAEGSDVVVTAVAELAHKPGFTIFYGMKSRPELINGRLIVRRRPWIRKSRNERTV
jgi:hypothetical protein